MKINAVLRRMLFDYIMVQSEITLSLAVIGTLFAKDASISYSYFFMPFYLGAICMLPCLIIYFYESMTIRQVLIQRALQLMALELVILGFVYHLMGNKISIFGYIIIGVSTFVFDIGTYLLEWLYERGEAVQLNHKLEEYHKRKSK